MSAPFIMFVFTGLVLLSFHLRHQVALFRAISKLNEQSRREGRDWSYWQDWQLRLRLLQDPTALFSESDSPAMRALKQVVMDRRAASVRAFPKMLAILLGGFLLTILAAVIERAFKA